MGLQELAPPGGLDYKASIPPPIPLRVIYRNVKYFEQNLFKEQVSRIPFHISSIFDDVSDQYWSSNWLFSEILNEHARLKTELSKKIMCHI